MFGFSVVGLQDLGGLSPSVCFAQVSADGEECESVHDDGASPSDISCRKDPTARAPPAPLPLHIAFFSQASDGCRSRSGPAGIVGAGMTPS